MVRHLIRTMLRLFAPVQPLAKPSWTVFVNESLNPAEFLRLLRETGATAAESADYVKQAKDLRDSAMELNRTQPNSREATPEGLSEEEVSKFRSERDTLIQRRHEEQERLRATAADDVEWTLLRAKVEALFPC
ncbi:hypothetical protein B0H14DRAFT_3156607 [Mycena olivaceomarginata]|nr:hypothetical protein B0H14DRAFT_3156607 [Mycena olivaceomarginata]